MLTAAPDMANRWGIDKDRIFSFEDGVADAILYGLLSGWL